MSARALPASLPLRLCAVHAAEHCASLESSPSRRSSRRCSVRARRRNGRGSPVDSADAPDAAVSAAGDSAAAPIGRCFAHLSGSALWLRVCLAGISLRLPPFLCCRRRQLWRHRGHGGGRQAALGGCTRLRRRVLKTQLSFSAVPVIGDPARYIDRVCVVLSLCGGQRHIHEHTVTKERRVGTCSKTVRHPIPPVTETHRHINTTHNSGRVRVRADAPHIIRFITGSLAGSIRAHQLNEPLHLLVILARLAWRCGRSIDASCHTITGGSPTSGCRTARCDRRMGRCDVEQSIFTSAVIQQRRRCVGPHQPGSQFSA